MLASLRLNMFRVGPSKFWLYLVLGIWLALPVSAQSVYRLALCGIVPLSPAESARTFGAQGGGGACPLLSARNFAGACGNNHNDQCTGANPPGGCSSLQCALVCDTPGYVTTDVYPDGNYNLVNIPCPSVLIPGCYTGVGGCVCSTPNVQAPCVANYNTGCAPGGGS